MYMYVVFLSPLPISFVYRGLESTWLASTWISWLRKLCLRWINVEFCWCHLLCFVRACQIQTTACDSWFQCSISFITLESSQRERRPCLSIDFATSSSMSFILDWTRDKTHGMEFNYSTSSWKTQWAYSRCKTVKRIHEECGTYEDSFSSWVCIALCTEKSSELLEAKVQDNDNTDVVLHSRNVHAN